MAALDHTRVRIRLRRFRLRRFRFRAALVGTVATALIIGSAPATPAGAGEARPAAAAEPAAPKPPPDPRKRLYAAALAAVLFAALATVSPPEFLGHFTVFALAVFVGYYVISNVHHALHTPLMSETNAISGIIVVGGILQVGSDNPVVAAIAVVAVLVASINIFGGFLVTLRMLEMFRKD